MWNLPPNAASSTLLKASIRAQHPATARITRNHSGSPGIATQSYRDHTGLRKLLRPSGLRRWGVSTCCFTCGRFLAVQPGGLAEPRGNTVASGSTARGPMRPARYGSAPLFGRIHLSAVSRASPYLLRPSVAHAHSGSSRSASTRPGGLGFWPRHGSEHTQRVNADVRGYVSSTEAMDGTAPQPLTRQPG